MLFLAALCSLSPDSYRDGEGWGEAHAKKISFQSYSACIP